MSTRLLMFRLDLIHRVFVNLTHSLVCSAFLFGTALTATAQDSVSKLQGLPGDAVAATAIAEQRNDYVVDLATFTSSAGNGYGIAPIVKSSLEFAGNPFFNNRMNSNGLSDEILQGVPFFGSSYSRWTAQGMGINNDATRNDPGTAVDATGFVGSQFGFALAEFNQNSLGDGQENNIIAGIVNYRNDSPSRLYVSRIVAMANSADGSCNDAQIGLGGVDAEGNLCFRADGFGINNSCGNPLPGNNYFRVDASARNTGVVNHISDQPTDYDGPATTRVVTNSATTHNVPNLIPASSAGGTARVMGTNFNSQSVIEDNAGLAVAGGAHFAPGISDHRGSMTYTKTNFSLFAGSTRGTGAAIGKDGSNDNRILNVFGLNSSNAPVAPRAIQLPASITDGDDNNIATTSSAEFTHVFSLTSFRGGVSQVALGSDASGNLLAAATANYPAHPAQPLQAGLWEQNLIAVSRTNAAGQTSWTTAAYVSPTTGKQIFDSTGTTAIGNLIMFSAINNGVANEESPSMSAPTMDAAGNIYFTAAHEITTPTTDTGVGLFRARYDATNFSYKLELLVRTGDVFSGVNSATDYQVRFLPLGAANSLSPASVFSNAATRTAYNGLDAGTLATGDPRALGGLALNASIVYDVNDDGMFDSTVSPDESYQVMLYIQPAEDCNGNGIADDIDIFDSTSTDSDMDGVPDDCSDFPSFCFGDGGNQMGCTDCPCGNNASIGSGGGCLNSVSGSAQLTVSGDASVSNDTLRVEANGMTFTSFALLVSGAGQAPTNMANPCFGLNSGIPSAIFDGLRCVVQDFQRHGSRSTSATGVVGTGVAGPGNNGWGLGSGPPGGLISFFGFSVGQTRHFQAFYRDNPALGCGTGQNTTQGVTVTITN